MMAKLRNKPFEILCGMLSHAAWRLLLAATIIALIPSTLAANYGEACSYHSDCTDKSAPFCKTWAPTRAKTRSRRSPGRLPETLPASRLVRYTYACRQD